MMFNGYSTYDRLETFITPSLKEYLPSIHLPGDEKFSSYKNTFQEYCQKKHLSVPQYKILQEDDGVVGTVTFSLNYVRCVEKSANAKEAESRAAFEALEELGYLKDVTFEVPPNQLKRKGGQNNSSIVSKHMKVDDVIVSVNIDSLSPKSQLNEIAQKRKIASPTYSTVAVSGGFIGTVKFNGDEYTSTDPSAKRKAAEQMSAGLALNSIVPMGVRVLQMFSEASQLFQNSREELSTVNS